MMILFSQPFEFKDNDQRSLLCEVDPELYFYNSTNFNDTIKCNYFDETTFNEADQIKNGRIDGALSMCHLNIRNIRKAGVFVETINAFIEKIKPEKKYCYLMGDYNIIILNFATLCLS